MKGLHKFWKRPPFPWWCAPALNPALVWRLFGVLPIARNQAEYDAVSAYPSRLWRANAVDDVLKAVVADSADEFVEVDEAAAA